MRRLGGVSSIVFGYGEGGVPENIGDYLVRGEGLPAFPGVDEAVAALVVVRLVLRVGRRVGGVDWGGDGERVCRCGDAGERAGGCCCHCCRGWAAEAEESSKEAMHGGRCR